MATVGQDLAVEVFTKYCDGNQKMGPEQLLRFLRMEQGEETASLEDAKRLLELILKDSSKGPSLPSLELKKEDFLGFMLNPKLNGPIPTDVYQDMKHPISHYWIFTGHNSYLTGNQLSSTSSEVPIINALKRGVRVVELDLWPDDDDRIKVTHGNTLTEPIALEKCLVAIKENAFFASQYPVCVTLEDHLTQELQAKAAEMLLRIFGDALYYPPSAEPMIKFPSPEDLKGRIIVSTKPPKEHAEAAAVLKPAAKDKNILKKLEKRDKHMKPLIDKVEADLHIHKSAAPATEAKSAVPAAETKAAPPVAGATSVSPATVASKDTAPAAVSPTGTAPAAASPKGIAPAAVSPTGTAPAAASPKGIAPAAPTPTGIAPASASAKGILGHESDSDEDDISKKAPEYSRLITIRQVKPAKGTSLKDRLVVDDSVKRISLAESKVKDVAEEFPELLVKFTERNILRVYPAGTRIDSSNYNPVLAWNHGCQMVALNMQGYGKELWHAHGRFRSNGGCGYVLKPKLLLETPPSGVMFNPLSKRDVETVLRVKVLMSLGWDKAFSKHHFDLFSPPDFFARVLVSGVPADEAKWKTQPIEDSWVPYWNEEYDFSLRVPELALLRIEIRDEDEESKDEFEGQTCLPITEIKNGYRCLQLYDREGREIPGVRMLVHFQKLNVQKVGSPTGSHKLSNPLTPSSPY